MHPPTSPPAASPQALRLQRRVAALEAAFRTVASTRMQGVPVLNAALRVQALGFALHSDAGDAPESWGLGLLITPWFMNLVRLPLLPQALVPPVGVSMARLHGGLRFDFIGAHEAAVGAYEACSLFSPMFEFADQAAAQAVAQQVLVQLGLAHAPAAAPAQAAVTSSPVAISPVNSGPVTSSPAAAAQAKAPPARRGFLLGRSAAGAGR